MPVIKENKQVASDYYYMKIKAPEICNTGNPGQFVHVKLSQNNSINDPLLRRPFSFHDINKNTGNFSLVYEIVGKGTKLLTEFEAGDNINILGPLGQGFNLNFKSSQILIIGGGMGIVPLYYLTKKLEENNDITVILGGNSETNINYFIQTFNKLNVNTKIATMDGSRGFEGNVIDLWNNFKNKSEFDFIYSCGPTPMLNAVQRQAQTLNISGQVSLEERMGCGFGVCLSCVCQTTAGNQRVCKEGPVFSLDEVIFDDSK